MHRRFQCHFRLEGESKPHSPVVIRAQDVADAANKLNARVREAVPLLRITECTIKAA